MQNKHFTSAKNVLIKGLVAIISIFGFTNDWCSDTKTAPGADKYCPTKVVNYYPKVESDGTVTIKPADITWGTVKANGDGDCPEPETTIKNQ